MIVLQERGRVATNDRPHDTGRLVPMLTHPTLKQRFWSKVNKAGPVPDYAPKLGPCWLWTATKSSEGYGLYYVTDKRRVPAHRLAYVDRLGLVPDGLELDHLCRIRNCVRPDHLEAVTTRVNILRGEGLAARLARPTHCVNGHPLSGDNLYPRPRAQGRVCRTCVLATQLKLRQAKSTGCQNCKHNKIVHNIGGWGQPVPAGEGCCRSGWGRQSHRQKPDAQGCLCAEFEARMEGV